MTKLTHTLGFAALTAASFAEPGAAHAHEQSGFGLGADLTLDNGISLGNAGMGGTAGNTGFTGLNGMLWATPSIALNFTTRVGLLAVDGGDTGIALGLAVGVFGVLASGDHTHLMLGGRLGVQGFFLGDFSQGVVSLDVPLRVEHWLDRHMSINGTVGLGVGIRPEQDIPFTLSLGAATAWGGVGFNFYFDAAQGFDDDHHAAPPPPAPAPRAQPAYQPPPPPPPAQEPVETPPPADPESGSAGW